VKSIIVCILLILLGVSAYGYGLDIYSSPQIIAGGEIYLLSQSPESAFYNPSHRNEGISVNHSNPFGMAELNIFHLASQFAVKGEVFSAGSMSLDNEYISDRVFYLGYSKEIRTVSLGISGRYYSQKVDEYSSLDTFTGVVGAVWKVDNLTNGLSFSNFTHTKVDGIQLPSVFKYELMVTPFESTQFALAIEKEKGYEMRYAFGARHNILKILSISTGFINNPAQFSAGLGVTIKNVEVNYGMRTHAELGYTQAVGVVYFLGDR